MTRPPAAAQATHIGQMMARRIAKVDFPSKICPVCKRPFAWRKAWSKVWADVRYCSDACRRQRRPPAAPPEK